MTIANWCVLLAALLPNGWSVLSKTQRTYDNRVPRDYEARLTGWRLRAHWTHLNSIEAFAPFAAGVLVAQQAGALQLATDLLAQGFIAARVLYGVCYLADSGWLRTTVYCMGLACVIGLFAAAAWLN